MLVTLEWHITKSHAPKELGHIQRTVQFGDLMPVPSVAAASHQRKMMSERQFAADCADMNRSNDLLRGLRSAPAQVDFRLVSAMRVSKQSPEKFGSAWCRRLNSLSALVQEVRVEPARVLVGGGSLVPDVYHFYHSYWRAFRGPHTVLVDDESTASLIYLCARGSVASHIFAPQEQ